MSRPHAFNGYRLACRCRATHSTPTLLLSREVLFERHYSFFQRFAEHLSVPVCDSGEGFARFCAALDVELHLPPSPVTVRLALGETWGR
jgi:hypothetical protein